MRTNIFFPEIHGNFGFGCMRLPMNGDKIDYDQFSQMADEFIKAGFNYFDTAHCYHDGMSEVAIGDCVSLRHDRSEFLIANKLTVEYFETQEDIRPFFEQQLNWCKVDYFDFYLMHAQDRNNYPKYQRCKAYETSLELKKEGKIKHLGLSFHDSADILDQILSDHPEVEFVQIQFNYADYEDDSIQSRKVYDVCRKHGKAVVVMEPVKGGSLVNLPDDAANIFRELNGGSNASYALRFAASFPDIVMVLSGMSDMAQMQDNISAMKDFKPLDVKEMDAVSKVCAIFKKLNLIPCTTCRYCIEQNECPKKIRIPDIFSALNAREAFHSGITGLYYKNVITSDGHGKASDCIGCGKCEKACPQHLEIRKLLRHAAEAFE